MPLSLTCVCVCVCVCVCGSPPATAAGRLSTPEVIITVTGGAQELVLSPRLYHLFSEGLTSAALSAKAWIVTGGTDSGVMKLVGQAIAARGATGIPVIGVAPWGAVNGRELLTDIHGDTVRYAGVEKGGKDGAPLNMQHTHFVLVDSGHAGSSAWGKEIPMRVKVSGH